MSIEQIIQDIHEINTGHSYPQHTIDIAKMLEALSSDLYY
jgi:hypothetical protein